MSSRTILELHGFEPEMNGRRILVDSFQTIDSGGSASILVGELEEPESSTPLKVALKVFPAILTNVTRKLLQRELDISRKVRHPLIISFLGTCDFDARTILVSHFMPNGNLCKYLEKNPDADRNRPVFQVSHAVLYLHEIVEVAHGDLKCENVLVSNNGDALLADFGLATTLEKAETDATTSTAIRAQGTLRFCAPELFHDDTQIGVRPRSKTLQSDIYAFGMLLLQAYTGRLPWYWMNDLGVLQQIGGGKTPPRPDVPQLNNLLWTVCEMCWKSEPDSRPCMRNIATVLEHNMESTLKIQGEHAAPTVDSIRFLYKANTEPVLLKMPSSESSFAELNQSLKNTSGALREDLAPVPMLTDYLSTATYLLMEHPEVVFSVAYMPDGNRIVSGCGDGAVRIWDAKSQVIIGEPARMVWCVAVSADGTRIVAATDDHTIRVLDVELMSTIALLEGHSEGANSVAFSPDGLRVVSGSDDQTVRVWDVASSRTIMDPIQAHEETVAVVAYSPDGLCIASGSWDDTVCALNAETGEKLWQTEVSSPALAVAFSPDGKRIVSGCQDGKLHVLDAKTGDIVLGPLQGHPYRVYCVAFSPEGNIFASAADDSTVRLWNAATGEELDIFRGHSGEVYSVAFSPDGKHIASASHDRTVRFWDAMLYNRAV